MNNRQNKLKQFSEKNNYEQTLLKETRADLLNDPNSSIHILSAAMEESLEKAELQENTPIYLAIHFLRSSIVTQSFAFQVHLYGNDLYTHDIGCETLFVFPNLFDVDRDFLSLKKVLRIELGQMKDYEVWNVLEEIYASVLSQMSPIFKDLLADFKFNLSNSIKAILYGGFMEPLSLIKDFQ